jgi:hypothetical protein
MAASAISEDILGVTATAAIAQYQPVQASGAPAVAAGNAMGFATIAAASGARVPVAVGLTAIAIAGAAIAVGALVEVHTTVTKVVTKSAGIAIGRALTAAAADGDQIEVWLIPN